VPSDRGSGLRPRTLDQARWLTRQSSAPLERASIENSLSNQMTIPYIRTRVERLHLHRDYFGVATAASAGTRTEIEHVGASHPRVLSARRDNPGSRPLSNRPAEFWPVVPAHRFSKLYPIRRLRSQGFQTRDQTPQGAADKGVPIGLLSSWPFLPAGPLGTATRNQKKAAHSVA
jgi:hypothetical protein